MKGNSPYFYHRSGGQVYKGTSWIDSFSEPNQNFPVCSVQSKDPRLDKLGLLTPDDKNNPIYNLPTADYIVEWDCEAVFRKPSCQFPSEEYPVFLSWVAWQGGSERAWVSQKHVCPSKDILAYRGAVVSTFSIVAPTELTIRLSAFNDEKTADPTDINLKEVIVHEMRLYRKVGPGRLLARPFILLPFPT
jgi:hypothetical protein